MQSDEMVDVVVVGFGLSAVPLVRELERTGAEFICISETGDTIWDSLSASGRLDFDLVSNYLTSFFSFDLASDYQGDYYPTAAEFHAMRRRWWRTYRHKIVRDRVVRVDNFDDHSLVFTESGETLQAKHVVFATGFSRPVHAELDEIDYSVSHRTFVFDTMGDSANLMISKLVPNSNKIIVRTNGFTPLDKVSYLGGSSIPVPLPDFEFHNFRYFSQEAYKSFIYGARPGSGSPPFLLGDQFPDSMRSEAGFSRQARLARGTATTKYWPIDVYAREFGHRLEDAIAQGYLLNDIAMWLWTGRVIAVPKNTPIDFEKKTISWAGFRRRFDHYVAGGDEEPRLPPITVNSGQPFQYGYRDSFMGVIPSQLNNIYLIGYTRPMVGGSPNIMEMQGLFVHKLITQAEFHHRIHRNLDTRIAAYNHLYYGDTPPGRRDHIMLYGFYIDELARLIGIDHRPENIQSLRDLIFYYAFPNHAFKYRIKGEYAGDGVGDLVQRVGRDHGGFVTIFAYMLSAMKIAPAKRQEWLRQTGRNLFNDLRHKERYLPFLDDYLRVYRRVTGTTTEAAEDPEWEAIAARATATSRRLASRIPPPADGLFNQAVQSEDTKLRSLLSQGAGGMPLIYTMMQMDPTSQKVMAGLLNPPEHDLPFLDP